MARLIGLVVSLFVLSGVAPARAVTLSLSPPAAAATVGGQVSVDLVVSDLVGTLGAFDVHVTFTPAILDLAAVAFGPFLGDESAGEATALFFAASGDVELLEVSALPTADLALLQPASFPLVTLTFDVLAAGSSDLGLSIESVADGPGDSLNVTTAGGVVTAALPTADVPLPTTLTLVTTGLLGLRLRRARSAAGVRRRRCASRPRR